MLNFMSRRLFVAVLVAFTVSVIAFSLLRLSGDLATMIAGEDASAQDIEIIRKQYGLDRPYYIQYIDWLGSAVHGDLGESMFYPEKVTTLIKARLPSSKLAHTPNSCRRMKI